MLLSGGTAVVTVLAAVLAAYPLSRYQMRFNKPFLYVVLFGTCLPITAMMVPVYSLFVQLNFLDSLAATTLFMAASSLPMAIWMTKNFMDSVPVSLEEAAWVDGASAMNALARIVVPLMRRDSPWSSSLSSSRRGATSLFPSSCCSLRASSRGGEHFQLLRPAWCHAYRQLAAYSVLYSVPVVLLYILVSRGIGGSFAMAGAVKG